jgi:hypothetical protein
MLAVAHTRFVGNGAGNAGAVGVREWHGLPLDGSVPGLAHGLTTDFTSTLSEAGKSGDCVLFPGLHLCGSTRNVVNQKKNLDVLPEGLLHACTASVLLSVQTVSWSGWRLAHLQPAPGTTMPNKVWSAKREGVKGRSRMNKAQLLQALQA